MKALKSLQSKLSALATAASMALVSSAAPALAADPVPQDPAQGQAPAQQGTATMSDQEIIDAMVNKSQGQIKEPEARKILAAMKQKNMKVTGYAFGWGVTLAFIYSKKTLKMDLSFKDAQSGEVTDLQDGYLMKLVDPGFQAGLNVKFFFVFLPAGTTAEQLDGAVYGHGISVQVDPGIGVQLAWLPSNKNKGNRKNHGDAFLVAPMLGAAAGVTFPIVEFTKR